MAHRQPNQVMHGSVSGGVTAPPSRVQAHIGACAHTRSRAGSRALNMRGRFEKYLASPAPYRNRMTTNDVMFHAAPVVP